jgi:hypothetical protein
VFVICQSARQIDGCWNFSTIGFQAETSTFCPSKAFFVIFVIIEGAR